MMVLLVVAIGLGGAAFWAARSSADAARPSPSFGAAGTAASPAATAVVPESRSYLVVIDFLAYAAEALASDPIAGSPDADELVAVMGDPMAFGAAVTDQAAVDENATSRCGAMDRTTVLALAELLNDRLPADQRIAIDLPESRSLLHWQAGEGFASLRVFARTAARSPSCADAGRRF